MISRSGGILVEAKAAPQRPDYLSVPRLLVYFDKYRDIECMSRPHALRHGPGCSLGVTQLRRADALRKRLFSMPSAELSRRAPHSSKHPRPFVSLDALDKVQEGP
ncbi:unnamed protein product, partial [Iphiclides podalirius]